MTNLPSDQVNQAQSTIDQANDILIALPSKPALDMAASGLSLYLALSSRGKRVSVLCPDQMTVEFNRLVGVDKIGNAMAGQGGKNLVISFPYQEGSIEKVSYNIENDTFNLVIEPREGYPMITPEMMRYSYSGGNTDVIITIGASTLNDLGSIYQNNQNLYSEKPVINIDAGPQNQRFGKINIVDQDASSISEMMVSLFSMLGLNLDTDSATNLYSGITNQTQNFTSSLTDAATFEAVTICMRHGARKPADSFAATAARPQPARQPFQQPQAQQPRPYQPRPQQQQPRPQMQQNRPMPQQQYQQPRPQQQNQPAQPQPQSQPQPQPQQKQEAPPDWLKPKIYKGSTLL